MRKTVVIDANIALKWFLKETDSDIAEALLFEWNKKKVIIHTPMLLTYEVVNILYQNVRSGNITLGRASESLAELLRMKLKFDFQRTPELSRRAIELADYFNLPATYDTHYLALAERLGCEFWTADKRMLRAVKGKLDWVYSLSDYSPQTSEG